MSNRTASALRTYQVNADVLALQEALVSVGGESYRQDLGPSGTDGVWGTRTAAAMRRFQEGAGLDVRGIQEALIHAGSGASTLRPGVTIATDGVLGPETLGALRAWRAEHPDMPLPPGVTVSDEAARFLNTAISGAAATPGHAEAVEQDAHRPTPTNPTEAEPTSGSVQAPSFPTPTPLPSRRQANAVVPTDEAPATRGTGPVFPVSAGQDVWVVGDSIAADSARALRNPDNGLRLHNVAVAGTGLYGQRNVNWLARLDPQTGDVARQISNGSTVIVGLGRNDVLQFSRNSAEFAQRVDGLMQRLAALHDRGAQVVVYRPLVDSRTELTEGLGDVYRDAAARHGVSFIELGPDHGGEIPRNPTDRIHPTAEGYHVLAGRILGAINARAAEAVAPQDGSTRRVDAGDVQTAGSEPAAPTPHAERPDPAQAQVVPDAHALARREEAMRRLHDSLVRNSERTHFRDCWDFAARTLTGAGARELGGGHGGASNPDTVSVWAFGGRTRQSQHPHEIPQYMETFQRGNPIDQLQPGDHIIVWNDNRTDRQAQHSLIYMGQAPDGRARVMGTGDGSRPIVADIDLDPNHEGSHPLMAIRRMREANIAGAEPVRNFEDVLGHPVSINLTPLPAEEVRSLQRALGVDADGVLGPQTRAAWLSYRSQHPGELPAGVELGERTREFMGFREPPLALAPPPRLNSRPNANLRASTAQAPTAPPSMRGVPIPTRRPARDQVAALPRT